MGIKSYGPTSGLHIKSRGTNTRYHNNNHHHHAEDDDNHKHNHNHNHSNKATTIEPVQKNFGDMDSPSAS